MDGDNSNTSVFLDRSAGSNTSFQDAKNSGISLGRPLSPYTPTGHRKSSIPNIFDQIADWFHQIISKRKRIGTAICSVFAGLFFVLLSLTLQGSAWQPMESVRGLGTVAFSAYTWMAALAVTVVYGIFISSCSDYLLKWDQPCRPSLFLRGSWIVAALSVLAHGLQTALVIYLTGIQQNREGYFLLGSFIVSATVVGVLKRDFRLYFASRTAKRGLLNCIGENLFSFDSQSQLVLALRDTFKAYQIALPLYAIYGVATWSIWSILSAVVSPSLHFLAFSVVYSHILLIRLSFKIMRELVMDPVSFPFPPPFLVLNPTPEQTRTLINVLATSDPFVKLFAWYDLCNIAWTDPLRRKQLFGLSQPGGRPRNWSAVCAACLSMLLDCRLRLESANTQLLGTSKKEVKEVRNDRVLLDRQAMRMPQRIRQQMYDTPARIKQAAILQASSIAAPRKAPPPTIWQRICAIAEEPQGVIPMHEAAALQLAVESLYQLVVSSYTEDEFGVVQKDIPGIIFALLAVLTEIDRHSRLRQTRVGHSTADAPLLQVRDVLQTAAHRIQAKFGSSLKALQLTEEELQQLDALL